MTSSAAFWDRMAPKYARHKIGDPAAYEYTLGRTRAHLRPGDRVLELGAGTGTTALQLAGDVRQIVATDISAAMIDIARAKAAQAGAENVSFEVASLDAALGLPGPFDAVLGMNLFHLIPDMEDRFARIAALLPPGGLFISKTPCLSDPSQGALRFALPLLIPALRLVGMAPAHVRRFDHPTLEGALTAAGFDIVEAGNFPARARYIVARRR